MTITISDNILKSCGLSEKEFLLEIAISLYQRKILSLGKAASLASLHRIHFQKALSQRKIPIHFSELDLEQDLRTLDKLGL